MSFENDLLDLCRLSEMEERNPRPELQRPIDWKKRRLVIKLNATTEIPGKDAIADHKYRNE